MQGWWTRGGRSAAAAARDLAVTLAAVCLLGAPSFAGTLLATPAFAVPAHPLDPLSAEEIAAVKDILVRSGRFSAQSEFAWIQLDEPPKAGVEGFRPGDDIPRKADAAAIDYAARKSFAVTVDIKTARIVSLQALDRSQPGLIGRDIELARDIATRDQRILQALARRGIPIRGPAQSLRALYMGVGTDPALQHERGRLVRVLFGTDQDADNDYGPILDTVMAVVDVYSGRVVSLYERPGVPVVKVPHDVFDPNVRNAAGARLVPPVKVTGRSFAVDGNVVDWGPWRMRFGFNPREGLVLYQISFEDHGRRRPIVYRASVSEVVSRYGDAGDAWRWMEFFDESTFGLGTLSTAVVPGREVPANAVTLSPVTPSPVAAAPDRPSPGEPEGARIYAYERDAGNLLYYRQGTRTIQQRATELVIGFLVPLGNYTYRLSWVFKQDGSFAFEAELAGEILTRLIRGSACSDCGTTAGERGSHRDDDEERSGTLVHPRVVGVDHQHWFNLRLDFDVDGPGNAVMENNVRLVAQQRPGRGASEVPSLAVAHTVLERAEEAKRDADEDASRSWTIFNPSSLGPTGRPVGYAVIPLGNTRTIYPRSREEGPAGFTFHHLWVTPYRDGELFADGRYPNQPTRNYADTLYFRANTDSIYDRDIVVWYSLGETHVPRPEDYPLMPDMTVSVLFRPDGFFQSNPALGSGAEP